MNLESNYNQENPVEKMMYYFNKACRNETEGKLTALMEIYEDYIIDAQNPFDFYQTTFLKKVIKQISSANPDKKYIEFQRDDVYVNLSLFKTYLLHVDSGTYELISGSLELMSESAITMKVNDQLFRNNGIQIEEAQIRLEKYSQHISDLLKSVEISLAKVSKNASKVSKEVMFFLWDIRDDKDTYSGKIQSKANSVLKECKALERSINDRKIKNLIFALSEYISTSESHEGYSTQPMQLAIENLTKNINLN